MHNIQMNYQLEDYSAAADFINSKIRCAPTPGLILGSGLGGVAEQIENSVTIPYQDIPLFPTSSAPSHQGCLVIGDLQGHTVMAMQGRVHLYEGYSAQEVTFPVRVMHLLGVEKLIVTNASGGINQRFAEADFMLIDDHINMLGMCGHDPLRGPNIELFGPRFNDLSHAYDSQLAKLAIAAAEREDLVLHRGVYAYVAGPSFETPAEVRMLAMLGADAVGMSTVPEVVVAKHCGMDVLAIASITNVAIQENDSESETTEDDIWEFLDIIVPRMTRLITSVLDQLAKTNSKGNSE
jgi:purine-nucleoside phosphorylase